MSIEAHKSTALAISVMNELVDRIVSGSYDVGFFMPTEGQLGTEFGVSRTVIRESVQMLVSKGMVRIDRGRGTLVEAKDEWRVLDPVVLSARLRHNERNVILTELFAIRRGIEPELAAIACEKLDDEALEKLQARMDDLSNSVDVMSDYLAADGAFHRCIAEIANVTLANEIFKLLATPLEIVRAIAGTIPDAVERSHHDHKEIFEKLRARDSEGAREAVRAHLDWAVRADLS
jgi:DNA-binding FadR family transcriptional regulator